VARNKHKEIEPLVDPKKLDLLNPDNICGALTKKGVPCRRHAGWGTNHYGRGPCKYHENDEVAQKQGEVLLDRREYIVGMVEPRMRKRLRYLINDPDLLNCRAELALLKLKLEEALTEGMPDPENPGERIPASLDLIVSLVNIIIKNTKIVHEMEVGKRHFVHVSVVGAIVEAFADVGRRYVDSPTSQKGFERDVIRILREHLKSERSGVTGKLLGSGELADEQVIQGN